MSNIKELYNKEVDREDFCNNITPMPVKQP